MSEQQEPNEGPDNQRGLNLKLVYGVLILALAAAIGLALLIVLPFYQRR